MSLSSNANQALPGPDAAKQPRLEHWPHAADHAKRNFDPERVEAQAIRILARGMRTQRLVAFVGSGASLAYGRLSWVDLLKGLYDFVEREPDEVGDEWKRIVQTIWNGKAKEFLEDKDYPLTAQVLSDILERDLTPSNATKLQTETRALLADWRGFVDWLVEQLAYEGPDPAGTPRKEAKVRGLKGVLAQLSHLVKAGNGDQSADWEGLVDSLARPSIGLDSPIRLLASDWGIRRFITTNYDEEIERSLEELQFMPAAAGSVQDNTYEALNLTRQSSGEALCFSVEGPRRNAAVLHIHGVANDPKSLVVTESDYQRLYLEDHPRRDLVTNATLASFAANPILFVGAGVNEADVMRPMRQFMSGPGHRSDRMAVAVFLSTQSKHKRAHRKLSLLLKYGVYVIDAGHATVAARTDDEPWFFRFTQIHKDFKSLERPRENGLSRQMNDAIQSLADRLQDLGTPTHLEGQAATHELDVDQELIALCEALRGCTTPASLTKVSVLFEVTSQWLGGLFVCAKLLSLHRQAMGVVEADLRPAGRYRRQMTTQAQGLRVYQRHAISFRRPEFEGRFQPPCEPPKPHRPLLDEGIDNLVSSIKEQPSFAHESGRRLIVVCGARGRGKGAQFDRLLVTRTADAQGEPDYPRLASVLNALEYPRQAEAHQATVLHFNLSFSDELGAVISQVSDVLNAGPHDKSTALPPSHDQLEMLERGLKRLASTYPLDRRVLIILGNAGVLFDADGRPKNGQISRVIRLFRSPHFAAAPLDVMMYVGESQMPAIFRASQPETRKPGPFVTAQAGPVRDDRMRRRLDRLNIVTRPPGADRTLIHALAKTRVSDLVHAYFPELQDVIGEPCEQAQLPRDLYFATGGSRYAQTLILAYLASMEHLANHEARELVTRLNGSPAGSAVEMVIEVVLDGWAKAHLMGREAKLTSLSIKKPNSSLVRTMHCLGGTKLHASAWALAKELLWHLSAFSHPVERVVLQACPGVMKALGHLNNSLAKDHPGFNPDHALEAMLELLVHWCLLFRVDKRPLPPDGAVWPTSHYRYAPHRHMQRHFLRLMGGRNVESTQWDQFTTTMYASQPDELPSLRPLAQHTLSQVVEALTHYPTAMGRPGLAPAPAANRTEQMLYEADRIRAAYYLVRSTYSLGVVSHYAADSSDATLGDGHMESYRRLVRWITHAAQYWEREYQTERATAWNWPDKTQAPATEDGPMGIFYPGELVWLYNEAGVISLAQGKLHDAEQLLAMAESAARRLEADETGSVHARIRLHTALTQIERGRPNQARQILKPIAERKGGHPVPPLLASFYLGLLEHIGGNYRKAGEHYSTARKGLRLHERSRATAFVLMGQADLERVMQPERPEAAHVLIEEAISLAQQGGHEDLRVLALLARTRISIDAKTPTAPSAFEQLSYAERYATSMDMPRVACEVHELRARLLLQQGEYHLSASEVTASLEIAALYDLKLMKARGLLTLAQVYLKRGELAGARAMTRMGKEIAASADYYACVRGFQELELSMNQPPPSHGIGTGEPTRWRHG